MQPPEGRSCTVHILDSFSLSFTLLASASCISEDTRIVNMFALLLSLATQRWWVISGGVFALWLPATQVGSLIGDTGFPIWWVAKYADALPTQCKINTYQVGSHVNHFKAATTLRRL